MKLDCEGAEFILLPHLFRRGLLKDFSLIMMEFHQAAPPLLSLFCAKTGYSFLAGVTGWLDRKAVRHKKQLDKFTLQIKSFNFARDWRV